LKRIGFKTTEKLDIEPARFIVRQTQCETVGCPKCHGYVRTAPRPDEVVDRGVLGNALRVQAMVDHDDNAVPFERMAQSAVQQGVPLSANTLAASVGRLVDRFDPVVRSLRDACELRPQGPMLKRLRRPNEHRAVAPARFAIRHKSVPPAERHKQLAFPRIR
jgi:transposase